MPIYRPHCNPNVRTPTLAEKLREEQQRAECLVYVLEHIKKLPLLQRADNYKIDGPE